MTLTLLAGARLFTGDRFLDGHVLVVKDGRIVDVVAECAALPAGQRIDLAKDSLLVPGFLDLQVNGAGGLLFNDRPQASTALDMARALRRFGVTGILPTMITDAADKMRDAGEAAVTAAATPGGGVLGVHLEGPFISRERRGCHELKFVRAPDETDLAFIESLALRLQDTGGRVLVTLAPECVADGAIARIAGAGAVVAAGHTAASYERLRDAQPHGIRGYTHLSNAMPPVANRNPGPLIAGLDCADSWCGVIADGVHVHPGLLRVMVAAKPRGKIFLVTDAMPPVGTDADSFQLLGQTILRRDGRLVTVDGVLAGADIDMAASVRNCVSLVGLPLDEALRMASLYPASFLRLDDRYGRLLPGYRADLTLLGPDLGVRACWVEGQATWFGTSASRPILSGD